MLSKEDIEHYQKIVVAISETIRIMGEIDQVIDAHGGWPGAFITDPVELEKLGLKSSASVPPVSPRDNRGSSSEAGEPSLPFA